MAVRVVPGGFPYDQDERSFTDQVVELAGWCGWRAAHFRPARTLHGWRTAMQGTPGFPDLVLLRPPRVVVAELKSRRGQLDDEQREWLDDWRRCGAEAFVWRPADWDSIVKVLSGWDR